VYFIHIPEEEYPDPSKENGAAQQLADNDI
jgi:hypothetical protein